MKRRDILAKLCPECMACAMDDGLCMECGYIIDDKPEYICTKAMRPRTVLNERYVLGKVISRSKFSTVYYAFDLDAQKRVIAECVVDIYNRMPFYTRAVKSTDDMIKDVTVRMEKTRALN
ncbi:MAG: hypothetical protein IJO93_00860, partial [Clostridia bacterium]|nr:hypothetical protein [Clostridia bacterium]